MEFTAQQIADFLGGSVEGDGNARVKTFAKIEEGQHGAISFLANPKYAHYLYSTQSSIVLVNRDFVAEQPVATTLVRVENAYEAVARLLNLYESMTQRRTGIHPLACVSETAEVGADTYIGPFAYIGDGAKIGARTQIYAGTVVEERASVGDDCILYPRVSVYHDCRIGNEVILHSGVVIGADGFGFAPNAEGYDKIPQIGIVIIEDNVEIGANTCIDRSTMGSTIIRKGVKLDNLIQVAHNCEIGENTVMSAQVGLAGSTKVGAWCMFGGQVGVAGHIQIGDKTFLGAQSGVPGSIKGNQTLIGTPPMEPKAYFKSQAIFRRLPDMYKQLAELQKQMDELKKQQ